MKTDANTKSDYLLRFLGEPIAIMCIRYWYRGIVSEVGADYIVLSQPRVIEVTGGATAEAASREEIIPSDLLISLDSIEIICRPTWTFVGFYKEKEARV